MFANATPKVGISQRVVATLVACAVVLMSIGIYTQTAQAASLSRVSDTLSDSAPAVVSDHTIVFSTPSLLANGSTFTISFADGPFVLGSVDFTDIDVATTSDYTIAATCAGTERIAADVTTWPVLTFTLCAGDGGSIPATGTTTIQIGTNATFGVAGNAQLTNPVVGSKELVITAGSNSGRTRVAIVNTVLVQAIVDTTFTFTVTGVATSSTVNGNTTTGSTSPTSVNYGRLVASTPEVIAQRLNVTTNARHGFVVTVESDGNLRSANGADIDNFDDGVDVTAPGTAWSSPATNVTQENTWGHWGVTTSDANIGTVDGYYSGVNFGSNQYIAVSVTPRAVFAHTGPANGTTDYMGSSTVAYKAEISGLQEAADDYQTVLTYIATPTF